MRISKRRYAELIRFYKSTIVNPKVSHRVRMSAAQRLDSIYSRHEFYELQAAQRKARADAAAEAQRTQDGPNPPQESAAQRQAREDEEVAKVFGRLLSRGKETDAFAE